MLDPRAGANNVSFVVLDPQAGAKNVSTGVLDPRAWAKNVSTGVLAPAQGWLFFLAGGAAWEGCWIPTRGAAFQSSAR